MNAKLALWAAVFLMMAMALPAMATVADGQAQHGQAVWSDNPDLKTAQDYASALSEGRDNVQPESAWIQGGYNNSLDYIENGRYYVAFYESGGKVVWVSVVDLDSRQYYQVDVTRDHFLASDKNATAVVKEAVRADGLEWGRKHTVPDLLWPAGAYDNSTDDFIDGRYIATYLVNGTAMWVSINDKIAYENSYAIDGVTPIEDEYQVDMTVREFKDSQGHSRG